MDLFNFWIIFGPFVALLTLKVTSPTKYKSLKCELICVKRSLTFDIPCSAF